VEVPAWPCSMAKRVRNLADLEKEWKCLLDLGFLISPVQTHFEAAAECLGLRQQRERAIEEGG